MKINATLLFNTISEPMMFGVYDENDSLVEEMSIQGRLSDVLPDLYRELKGRFEIKEIIYVNTPGSYMGIKVGYIFFKSLSILSNIKFQALSGFELNHSTPIKAIKESYFVRQDGQVRIKTNIESGTVLPFFIPQTLNRSTMSSSCEPIYILPTA